MMPRVDDFEALRPHLLAVAYRLTGMFADAEDIVQDAWLRSDATEPDHIADQRAWLTTVVSRLGLDRLRSASRRRESYVGQWLPEPMVTGFDDADPLSAVVAGEEARFAAMVVLERLTPASVCVCTATHRYSCIDTHARAEARCSRRGVLGGRPTGWPVA